MYISIEQLQAMDRKKYYDAMMRHQLEWPPSPQGGLAGQTPVKQVPIHKPENPDKLLLLLEEDECG